MRAGIYISAIIFNAAVLVLLNFTANVFFRETAPTKMAYEIPALDPATLPPQRVVGFIDPIEPLMDNADIEAGKRSFKKCVSCHAIADNARHKVGPNLWNVIGMQPGTMVGFRYSTAMVAYGEQVGSWTIENLNMYLADPQKLIKGTITGQLPIIKAAERADLFAYLQSQSSAR